MNKLKQLWEHLARSNSCYYINSGYGKGITEEQFWASGERDYKLYLEKDELITSRGDFLEIGCGTGRMTKYIVKDFRFVVGIDISGEMIRQAMHNVKARNVEFIETNGSMVPLPGKCMDVVFSYLVFQHIKSMDMIVSNFKDVHRVLKDDGIFKAYMVSGKKWEHLRNWWAGVEFDNEKLLLLAEQTGFSIIKSETYGKHGV